MLKRTFDYILALLGIFLSLPLWFVFGILIWLEDRGPVFYLQERVGKDGKIFKGIKFRSMVPRADEKFGFLQAQEGDLRVTRIGRVLRATAMDELPQLLNILKGDMSFVGPRALLPKEREIGQLEEKSAFELTGFQDRCKVRPGLTGVAQVFARRDISRLEKFRYDIWYIKNQGVFLDIYLIILSFWVTFKARWEAKEDKFLYLAGGLKRLIEKELRK